LLEIPSVDLDPPELGVGGTDDQPVDRTIGRHERDQRFVRR
jgi:hypothetical protein